MMEVDRSHHDHDRVDVEGVAAEAGQMMMLHNDDVAMEEEGDNCEEEDHLEVARDNQTLVRNVFETSLW